MQGLDDPIHREKLCAAVAGRAAEWSSVPPAELKPGGRRRGGLDPGWGIRGGAPPQGEEEGEEEEAVAGDSWGLELGGGAWVGRKLGVRGWIQVEDETARSEHLESSSSEEWVERAGASQGQP